MMNKPSIEPLKIAIKALKEQDKKERKWEKTFNEMFDGRFISQMSIILNTAICKMLTEIYHDTDDIIGWWMFEKDFGKKKDFNMWDKDHKIIPMNTVEDLYNALMDFYFPEEEIKYEYIDCSRPYQYNYIVNPSNDQNTITCNWYDNYWQTNVNIDYGTINK